VTSSVYVYGVVDAGDAAAVPVDGVAGCAVRTIPHGRLAALVSDLDASALSAARAVREHWRVLQALVEEITVIPVRFGTVLDDDAAVRDELLGANAERLEPLLASLAGRVQLKVEGRYDEDRMLRAILTGSPRIAALQQRVQQRSAEAGYYDRIRLGEAVAAAVDARRGADADRARAALVPQAVADRVEDIKTPDAAFNLSFLVARDRVDAFGAAVADLREELRDDIEIRYVGPLPPSSFAEAELQPAGAT
jgi:Gas vesicle synthesis protein GvpL/GvpF